MPHSFTGDLVCALIHEWHLDETDNVLDPFAGAGTTLLAAKESGVPGSGYDLSPLAVLASNTKTACFCRRTLQSAWIALRSTLNRSRSLPARRPYPELVRKALPSGRLDEFDAIALQIAEMDCAPRRT